MQIAETKYSDFNRTYCIQSIQIISTQGNKKPDNQRSTGFLFGGLSRQKIEPNTGIIEQDLYFKAITRQKATFQKKSSSKRQ